MSNIWHLTDAKSDLKNLRGIACNRALVPLAHLNNVMALIRFI